MVNKIKPKDIIIRANTKIIKFSEVLLKAASRIEKNANTINPIPIKNPRIFISGNELAIPYRSKRIPNKNPVIIRMKANINGNPTRADSCNPEPSK